MEYLVNMTTRVPEGTAQHAVDDVRNREATRSRELAAEGHLLRLWRPPLELGEWRTLGLFAAATEDELEKVLASMPLRVWRTDDVTPLLPHPNDPALASPAPSTRSPKGAEFLTKFVTTVPPSVDAETVESIGRQEALRAYELAGSGRLVRLWTLPGDSGALGLWQVRDDAEMQDILMSLPLYQWMTIEATPLTEHPNDPGLAHAD